MKDESSIPRGPAIEAEREFFQIGLQVVGGNGALVGSEYPTLQQTRDSVHAWHRHMCRVRRGTHDRALVGIAKR